MDERTERITGHRGDQERYESRANHLLPEEESTGSDDPRAQAEAILQESDVREDDPRAAAPDSFLERRTSEQATGGLEPPD
jgi:hypothetical protein